MVIGQMQSGKVSGIPQDKSQATKAPKLTKEHGLLDWSRPARDVCNQIRAMSPWPTAYTFLHRSKETALRFIVHRAVPLDRQTELPPGQLLLDEPKPTGLRVATGAGTAVEILELQPAGKKRMAAMEFLRGVRLHQGDHLGSAAL